MRGLCKIQFQSRLEDFDFSVIGEGGMFYRFFIISGVYFVPMYFGVWNKEVHSGHYAEGTGR